MVPSLVLLLLLLSSCHAKELSPETQPIEEQPDVPDGPPAPPVPGQDGLPVVRIFSKANPALSLTGLWSGKATMMLGNGSIPYQQWLVDPSWGLRFTDAVGSRAFMLINRATGLILRHGYLDNSPVVCSSIYKSDIPEALWTRGPVSVFGYHTIRACNRIELSLDMERCEKKRAISPWEGSKLVLAKCDEQETQYWKMEPIFT